MYPRPMPTIRSTAPMVIVFLFIGLICMSYSLAMSRLLIIPQFYLIAVFHNVLFVFGIFDAIYRHFHIRSERTHILAPALEELTEHYVFFPHDPTEFEVDDGHVVVSMYGSHRCTYDTEVCW